MRNQICKVCKTDHNVGPAHHAFQPISPRSYNPKSCLACECEALPGKRFCQKHSDSMTLSEKLQVMRAQKVAR